MNSKPDMSSPYRYCCPQCGSHAFRRRVRAGDDEHPYQCRGWFLTACRDFIPGIYDKKEEQVVTPDGSIVECELGFDP